MALKYKIGDKVRIKNFDWYNKNKDAYGEVRYEEYIFVKSMASYCGSILTIEDKTEDYYQVKENTFWWTDEMIEGLVEEETYDFLKTDKPNRPSLNDFMDMLDNEIKLPQGYQFKDENGNVINATKIVLEKKKKQYPKTYEECCDVLKIGEDGKLYTKGYKASLIQNFQKLIICRDAYWKIAGEEMGLGKPWKPDWLDDDTKKYIITSTKVFEAFGGLGYINYVLTFPTKEMRDAFYENFDKDLEFCKELL